MIIESHYIFLPKEKAKKRTTAREDETIVLNLHRSVGEYISKTFTLSSTVYDKSIFKRAYDTTINVSDITFKVVFLQYDVGKNVYLSIKVDGKTKHQSIKCLEHVQDKLLCSGIEEDYITIISFDSISEYYCNKLYPKLNSLERKLRRLLFNTYVVNFDHEYYKTTISEELQINAKKLIQAKGSTEKKEERRIQEFFYSMEFFDIQQLLFSPTWNDYDEKQRQDFLNSHVDLTKLTDEELRKQFTEFSPKSDWERFVIGKTNDTTEEIIATLEEIRKFRNKVAHCKFLSFENYNACKIAILKMSRAIDQALKITEEKDFYDKNIETLSKSFERMREELNEAMKEISKTVREISRNITESFRGFFDGLGE